MKSKKAADTHVHSSLPLIIEQTICGPQIENG